MEMGVGAVTWVKLDDSFAEHPKIANLSDGAFRSHLSALCYAARLLTDGWVPTGILPQIRANKRVVAELVGAGLWEEEERGYRLHDFLEYNPTRAAAEQRRNDRAHAGRLGGLQSGKQRASKFEAKSEASASVVASPVASHMYEANANPVPVPVPPTPSANASGLVSARKRASSPRPKSAFRPLTDEQRSAILDDFAEIPELREEVDFALSHTAHDKCTDENLYLRHWLRGTRERLKGNLNGRTNTPARNPGRHDTGDEAVASARAYLALHPRKD